MVLMKPEIKPTAVDLATFTELKKELAQGLPLKVQIISGSMEPVIMTGDEVRVTVVQFESLKRFDPIIFWNGKMLVCHYVWHFNHIRSPSGERIVLTRAMKGKYPDFPTPESQILGIAQDVRIPWYLQWRELWNRGKIK